MTTLRPVSKQILCATPYYFLLRFLPFCIVVGTACGSQSRSSRFAAAFPLASVSESQLCDALTTRRNKTGPVFRDPEPKKRRKVIVSDLHLGPGTRGKFAELEDFFFEQQWDRFLTSQQAQGPTDLIIAGDFIEFWQILGALDLLPPEEATQPGTPLLAATQRASLKALELVLAAHAKVFTRLGKFLNHGDNRIVILPGNHDADLLWPRVQLRIAQAIAPNDINRLIFVDAIAYQHHRVHVEHGHLYDGANRLITPETPVLHDTAGKCRLQTTWGELFVARVFNDLERASPFVDNLYPESAALAWGLPQESNRLPVAVAATRFIDLLLSSTTRDLNIAALSTALRGLGGLPAAPQNTSDPGLLNTLSQRFLDSDASWQLLHRLISAPKHQPLRNALAKTAKNPSLTNLLATFKHIDLSALRAFLAGDPMAEAAKNVLRRHKDINSVIFGHTHLPGGIIKQLRQGSKSGYYANTGAWVIVRRVSELRAKNIPWKQLNIHDTKIFPPRFPAIVIEPNQPPKRIFAQ